VQYVTWRQGSSTVFSFGDPSQRPFQQLLGFAGVDRSAAILPWSENLEEDLNEVMVHRLKDDLPKVSGGFPERRIVQENIDGLAGL
jgi:hypothetical protein